MSQTKAQIIYLDSVDSTNNYAMRLINGNKALHGVTVIANAQTNGKGQRGKTWVDAHGDSLLMSIVAEPRHVLESQFLFNAAVAVSVAKILQNLYHDWKVAVKWPNDIIINDKKAGGILIENVLRGSQWVYSVIGLGLNINQGDFPEELPYAISLKIASGRHYDIGDVMSAIREEILQSISGPMPENEQIDIFNNYLFKKGNRQTFLKDGDSWDATILEAQPDGTLKVQLEGGAIAVYTHGQVIWQYA